MLAKANPNVLLGDHTQRVVGKCELLISLVGPDLCRFYRIDDADGLHRLLVAAAILHDLGKANDHFQRAVRSNLRDPSPQAVRHEAISYAIVRLPKIRDWLSSAISAEDLDIISWVVAGHHRKFPQGIHDASKTLTVHLSHPEVTTVLGMLAEHLGLRPPSPLQDLVYDSTPHSSKCPRCFLGDPCGRSQCSRRWIGEEFVEVDAIPDHGFANKNLIACLKTALIVGDVLASIEERKLYQLDENALELLTRTFTAEMADEIVRGKIEDSPLTDLQRMIAERTSRVTLVESGCGAGKTIVGYRWARRASHGRKLYFAYPTQGTTTAGYDDYLGDADATMIHGMAELDLANPKRAGRRLERGERGERGEGRRNADLDSDIDQTFRSWERPVIACTADTVLGLLQNYQLGVLGVAAFANGAFVFDEIHSYDESMWHALLRFIQFDVPCLLMTASLPARRVAELEKALSEVGETLDKPESRSDKEAEPRYVLPAPSTIDREAAWEIVERAAAEGHKVLWISNTVAMCVEMYEMAVFDGLDAVCHHSRFKAPHRARNHNRVISAFKDGGNAPVVFATQVAEMSLDISADVLITELATISALIQRLGRLNRDGKSPVGSLYVLNDAHGKAKYAGPYDPSEVKTCNDWLNRLNELRWLRGEPLKLSQNDLTATWMAMPDASVKREVDILHHLDDIAHTKIGSLRNPSGVSIDVVLEEDVEFARTSRRNLEDVKIRMAVNSKLAAQCDAWPMLKVHVFVPPRDKIAYSEDTGARWLDETLEAENQTTVRR